MLAVPAVTSFARDRYASQSLRNGRYGVGSAHRLSSPIRLVFVAVALVRLLIGTAVFCAGFYTTSARVKEIKH